jgi:hypothetical protein
MQTRTSSNPSSKLTYALFGNAKSTSIVISSSSLLIISFFLIKQLNPMFPSVILDTRPPSRTSTRTAIRWRNQTIEPMRDWRSTLIPLARCCHAGVSSPRSIGYMASLRLNSPLRFPLPISLTPQLPSYEAFTSKGDIVTLFKPACSSDIPAGSGTH